METVLGERIEAALLALHLPEFDSGAPVTSDQVQPHSVAEAAQPCPSAPPRPADRRLVEEGESLNVSFVVAGAYAPGVYIVTRGSTVALPAEYAESPLLLRCSQRNLPPVSKVGAKTRPDCAGAGLLQRKRGRCHAGRGGFDRVLSDAAQLGAGSGYIGTIGSAAQRSCSLRDPLPGLAAANAGNRGAMPRARQHPD